jgi:IS30 family transposase
MIGGIMQRVRRSRMTDGDKAAIWERWKRGESLSEIGRAINRIPGAVFHVVRARGGVPPAPRCRSERALTAGDREEISRGLAAGISFSQIGVRLGRPTSTVSREVGRHGGRRSYRAAVADTETWNRALRPQRCRLAQHPALRARVAEKLEADWSPQQIAGWLKRTYPKDPDMRVSHETIYLSLFVQSRGVLKQALIRHLRRRKTMRRSRHATTAGQARGQIIDAVSIRERPASIEDRAIPGHWEGDLLAGKANSHIATLVERQSRFVMLVHLPGKDTTSVVRALTRRVRRLPQGLMSSLTWDRGMELAAHKSFSVATKVRVYFCDPHSPWQRGSNENTNGLLRQYFPDGTDLSTYTQANLNAVARRLNMRPRKTLDYNTPADTLAACVASTP